MFGTQRFFDKSMNGIKTTFDEAGAIIQNGDVWGDHYSFSGNITKLHTSRPVRCIYLEETFPYHLRWSDLDKSFVRYKNYKIW